MEGCLAVQYSSRAPIPPIEGSMPIAMNVGGFTPFQYSSRAPKPRVEWSKHLGMNVLGVYTLPIFVACPHIHCRGVYMTRDEYWSGVDPPNVHCVVLHPHLSGLYPW